MADRGGGGGGGGSWRLPPDETLQVQDSKEKDEVSVPVRRGYREVCEYNMNGVSNQRTWNMERRTTGRASFCRCWSSVWSSPASLRLFICSGE